MLSLGIDYHGAAWTMALWDEAQAADLHTFSDAVEVWGFLEDTQRAHPGLPVVLPSGLGVPVTRAEALMDRDIGEMILAVPGPDADALAAFLRDARRRLPRAFCVPAVKRLPSVPAHRKANRLDLGTSDALCAAAWVLHCLRQAGRSFADCSFLHMHLGLRDRALLAVAQGRIVDGMGATTAGLGPTVGDTVGDVADPRVAEEALQKEAYAFLIFHRLAETILTGPGRQTASQALTGRLPHTLLPASVDGHEAALGAAVIAAGLTGGPAAPLVDHLGLREAR